MSHYTHFTTEERELSRVMRAQGYSDREIAQVLNRSNSSVSREFARNSRSAFHTRRSTGQLTRVYSLSSCLSLYFKRDIKHFIFISAYKKEISKDRNNTFLLWLF